MRNWFRTTTALVASSALWIQVAIAQQSIDSIEPISGSGIDIIVNAVKSVINWMLMIAGVLAVAYLVYAGIQYIIGGSEGAKKAKDQIIGAVTGIIIIILSYVIVNTVIGLMSS